MAAADREGRLIFRARRIAGFNGRRKKFVMLWNLVEPSRAVARSHRATAVFGCGRGVRGFRVKLFTVGFPTELKVNLANGS
jgi:hypothetical protein